MRRDHRPYWLRSLFAAYEAWYMRHYLLPSFDAVGLAPHVEAPWHVHVFGDRVRLGSYVEMRATAEAPVRFTTWRTETCQGEITVEDYALIGPGARLQSASGITIGPGAMLASNVLISDADWHDLYDRLSVPGKTAPVVLEENAWIGDSAILCKGVRVGRHAVVGAGSVVVRDVPDYAIAAGNPAKVVRMLDPAGPFVTRRTLYNDPEARAARADALYRILLQDNTVLGWLRSQVWPRRGD